ncbi:MAG: restriction endonuclease subunit S [Bacteroidota bacterium]|nr:restriction endonuclease subunit S [Bacteroidota bacterium]
MSNETTKTAVPKLRFPEFREAEAWNIERLGNIAKLITKKAGSKPYKLMSITSGLGLVSQMAKFGREIAGESYKNYYVIEKGDFAYNKSSTKLEPEGQIAVLENEDSGAVPNSIFTCFRVDEQIVSPYFLKYPFANNIHGSWLQKFISVGARANGALGVDSKDLLAVPIAIPSLTEQQKISSCLASLDDLLTVQSAKLAALQAHKRGLMQGLFPAEGETVPKLRFPEFQDAAEWGLKTFGEVLEIIDGDRGVNYPKANEFSESGYCVFLSAKNVTKTGFAFDEIQFINEKKDASLRKGKLKRLDVVLTTRGSVGHFAFYSNEIPFENMRVNSGMVLLRPKNSHITPSYLY